MYHVKQLNLIPSSKLNYLEESLHNLELPVFISRSNWFVFNLFYNVLFFFFLNVFYIIIEENINISSNAGAELFLSKVPKKFFFLFLLRKNKPTKIWGKIKEKPNKCLFSFPTHYLITLKLSHHSLPSFRYLSVYISPLFWYILSENNCTNFLKHISVAPKS